MQSFVLLLVASLSLIGGVFSKPTPVRIRQNLPTPTDDASQAQSTACGDIIDAVDQGFNLFYASDAFDCLTSVPFNPAVATRFINYINTTLQFQSTLAYLENPPQGYQQPRVDVFAGLQIIQNNVTAGYYTNQYAFEADLQLLLYSTHDGHVYLNAGVLSAFSFGAPFSISAASTDGKALPKVYVTDDIIAARDTGAAPSAIKTINGQDAIDYLTELANLNSVGTLEPNADWNQLFDTPPLDVLPVSSVFGGDITFYPGDELNLTLENGTDIETFWLAIYNNIYTTGPLSTGGDFYNYFVLGILPASYNDNNTYNAAYSFTDSGPVNDSQSWNNITSGAYPNPDVAQKDLSISGDGIVSGYFLPDVNAGVLSIPSFDESGYGVGNFSDAVQNFIDNATAAKLSRVVIDLQQNTGGTLELVFSTFKRFFPDLDPFAGSRRRDHPLGTVLGESLTAYWDSLTPDNANYTDLLANEWVITPRLNAATGQNFTSWAEYYGPMHDNGDQFSLTERFNLSSEDFNFALFDGWSPYGYTPDSPPVGDRPFQPQDIVLLTDGICSSACAVFVEFFTQAGVRTTVLGGRPTTGPMQAVGGTRGATPYSADDLDSDIDTISGVNETAQALLPALNEDEARDSGVFTTFLGVNLRDQVRPNETVPIQFKYEAADCRLFYTIANLYNMSLLWRDIVSASFDNPSLCVEGSTGYTGNSSKPAPEPPQLKMPSLNPGDADHVDMESNLTGGLDDPKGGSLIKGGPITACRPGRTCDAGSGNICRGLTITCNGHPVETELCVPGCSDNTDCARFGASCFGRVQKPQKPVSGNKPNPVVKSSGSGSLGFCHPNTGRFCGL